MWFRPNQNHWNRAEGALLFPLNYIEKDSYGNEMNFPVHVSNEGKLGFVPYGIDYYQMDSLNWLKLNITKYTFFSAFPAGVRKTGEELRYYIDQFKVILNPKTEEWVTWCTIRLTISVITNLETKMEFSTIPWRSTIPMAIYNHHFERLRKKSWKHFVISLYWSTNVE